METEEAAEAGAEVRLAEEEGEDSAADETDSTTALRMNHVSFPSPNRPAKLTKRRQSPQSERLWEQLQPQGWTR